MARYSYAGRTYRTGKKMGSSLRSGMRSSRTTRSRRYGSYRRTRRMQRFSPRFATVGFNRDVEKKYLDRSMKLGFNGTSGTTVGTDSTEGGQSFIAVNANVFNYNAAGTDATVTTDLLKGLETGTTVRTRIGNKIRARYLKGAITFTAASILNASGEFTNAQFGEAQAVDTTSGNLVQYLRTTYRVCIVKDLQVNSTSSWVTWNDVMENSSDTTIYGYGGVHSELNIANMGRFVILFDKYFDLDADDPQKTCPFTIPGSTIGEIRYNGPDVNALTDKGIHIIVAAYVQGVQRYIAPGGTKPTMNNPSVTLHSRLCFIDA